MGCMSGMVRTIMFIFNFACLAVGIVLIGVGSVFYVSVDEYMELIEGSTGLNVVPSLTIAVGVIIVIISFFGCCGALKHNSCMLTSYAVILIVILIAQFAVGIYGVVIAKDDNKDFQDEVTKLMSKAFEKYKTSETIQDLFQSFQSELECCGVKSPTDYVEIGVFPLPGGCCGNPNDKTCPAGSIPYTNGCATKMFDTINSAIKTVAIVALAICGVELLGAIFAICLVRSKN